jgi:hypothetical protein
MRTPGRGTGEANGRKALTLTDMVKSTNKRLMLSQSLFEGKKHKGAVDGGGAVAGSGHVDGAGRKWGMDESSHKPQGSPCVKMEAFRDCEGVGL